MQKVPTKKGAPKGPRIEVSIFPSTLPQLALEAHLFRIDHRVILIKRDIERDRLLVNNKSQLTEAMRQEIERGDIFILL